MQNSEKPLLNLLRKKPGSKKPIWLMRQAGRYLPEYRELRKRADSFVSFCLSPKLAHEATIQPLNRFDLDAAILFADILLIPYGLGQGIVFKEREGPILDVVENLNSLKWEESKITSVYETLCLVKTSMDQTKTLIGFCGGLWTVACYMVDGKGKTGFSTSLASIKIRPGFIAELLTILSHATLSYLKQQIRAGAEVIQIFDSHAGLLREEDFRTYVIQPTQKLVAELKKEFPDIPIVGFPRGALEKEYQAYFLETGVDAIGLDQNISLEICERLAQDGCVQGNLAPELLVKGGQEMKQKAEEICNRLGPNHIFNLGHGILPQTPPEHVSELISTIRRMDQR